MSMERRSGKFWQEPGHGKTDTDSVSGNAVPPLIPKTAAAGRPFDATKLATARMATETPCAQRKTPEEPGWRTQSPRDQ